jgi:8-oxo-dGTP pyrophosphatase MutT (NUDIX family)
MNPAIPAATLVIFRDMPGSPPEILMVERSRAMAFALVFPGGRVDPGDRALAATLADTDADADPDDMAARIAAIRETLEEAGIAIGLDPLPSPDVLAAIRAGLHRGEPFGALLAAAGIALRPERLVPFARWLPSHHVARIFDTRFYLAQLPDDAGPASVDRTENVRLIWTGAADVLAQAAAGTATLIFPTRRNLERLAQFARFEDAVADAAAHPVRTITPTVEERDGVEHICIPIGIGYPVVSEPLNAADRG